MTVDVSALKLQLPSLEEIGDLIKNGALGEPRSLTREERTQAKADSLERAANKRNRIGDAGEAIVQGFLERKFKTDWRKSPTVPQPEGYGFYSTDVDLLGGLGFPATRKARCEVKTATAKRIPYSSFNPNERCYFANALRGGELAFAAFVWVDKALQFKSMHVIPWTDVQRLEAETANDYGGKSLSIKDKRIVQYEIVKVNGRFYVPETHWIFQYLPKED